MRHAIRASRIIFAALALCLGAVSVVQAQSPIEMEFLRERVQAEKRTLIEANLDLTAAEAAEFWPIYDEFQTEIEVLNSRTGWLIRDFGAAYDAGTITEEQAEDLLDEAIAIDADEASLRRKFARQFRRVLPPAKVVRYLQIENKIRAAVRYDLAANIALFE